MNILTSKRIAGTISIILCLVMYLLFLSAFTTERDTYICYTTKTGECFHSMTCQYINTAYETTVYEACKSYKPCKYCNPCVEKYKTTIKDRNYVIPIVISAPVSIFVFFLLTFKTKKTKNQAQNTIPKTHHADEEEKKQMYCNNCGALLIKEAAFCNNCGRKIK